MDLPPSMCTCNVRDYGPSQAVGGDWTGAFREAVAACSHCSDGSEVLVPSGTYTTGPFNLSSHMLLNITHNAKIMASNRFESYPIVPPLPSYGSGREFPGPEYAPFIGCWNCSNTTIAGGGVIDGNGHRWWEAFRNKDISHTRPRLIQFRGSSDITVTNVTLRNSPFWTLHFIYCQRVTATHLTIRAPVGGGADAPNTDGIDPDSSSDVLISNCDIRTGDDAIAIKSGWDQFGQQVAIPAENIVIRNSVFHGPQRADGAADYPCCNSLSIGSEMSGGVRNISAHNLIIRNTPRALYIKTARGRGGYVKGVRFANIQILGSNQAIRVAEDYREVHPNQTAVPMVSDISFNHIQALRVDKAVTVIGLPDAVITEFNGDHNQFVLSPGGRAAGDPYECRFAKGSWTYVSPKPTCAELVRREAKIDYS